MKGMWDRLQVQYYQWQRHWVMRPRLRRDKVREPLRLPPPDLWPGDMTQAQLLRRGKFRLYGEEFPVILEKVWQPFGVSEEALGALHRFEWLRGLRQLGDHDSRLLARNLISDWIETAPKSTEILWRFDIVGQRLSMWLGVYDFFGASADIAFQSRFHQSIRQQCDYLMMALRQEMDPWRQLVGMKGLILAILSIPGYSRRLFKFLPIFQELLHEQIGADGMHKSRNPVYQFVILRDLVDIRSALHQSGYGDFTYIQTYIEAMAPVLRLYRHGDGGLAQFGAGRQVAPEALDSVLSYAGVEVGRSAALLGRAGLERIVAQKSLVLVDAGNVGKLSASHVGAGAFEVSVGRQRILVNSAPAFGGYRRFVTPDHDWERFNNLHIPMLAGLPSKVHPPKRIVDNGHTLLTIAREWSTSGGRIRYERELYVHASGEDIRGQDRLIILLSSGYEMTACPVQLRFLWHPSVQVSTTPKSNVWQISAGNNHWYFYTDQSPIWELQSAVYIGRDLADTVALSLNTVAGDDQNSRVWRWALKKG
jgi:uncharacterized heparinase superfamily protein